MAKKPRTPDELSKRGPHKETYCFTLNPEIMSVIIDMSKKNNVSKSALVEAAIEFYVDTMKDK